MILRKISFDDKNLSQLLISICFPTMWIIFFISLKMGIWKFLLVTGTLFQIRSLGKRLPKYLINDQKIEECTVTYPAARRDMCRNGNYIF